MAEFTNLQKWKCAQRELGQRIGVYARRVALGKMTQPNADREIALMREIATEYQSLYEKELLI